MNSNIGIYYNQYLKLLISKKVEKQLLIFAIIKNINFYKKVDNFNNN